MLISFTPAISALLYRSQFLVQKMDLKGNSGLQGEAPSNWGTFFYPCSMQPQFN